MAGAFTYYLKNRTDIANVIFYSIHIYVSGIILFMYIPKHGTQKYYICLFVLEATLLLQHLKFLKLKNKCLGGFFSMP